MLDRLTPDSTKWGKTRANPGKNQSAAHGVELRQPYLQELPFPLKSGSMKFCPPAILAAATVIMIAPNHAQTISADDASEQFFRGYLLKNDAEKLEAEGNLKGSLSLYEKMQQIFDGVAQSNPKWQPGMLSNRRGLTQQAIARIQAKLSQPAPAPTPAPTQAAAPAPAAAEASPASMTGSPATTPNPDAAASPLATGGTGSLPSLNETLSQWEQGYRQRISQLESQNNQIQVDLGKWQQWYQWASGEITAARADKQALELKTAKLEESMQAMKLEVAAGRATQQQLDVLTKEKIGIEVEYKKVTQRLAAAENGSKDSTQKLAEAFARITEIEQERNKFMNERDAAIKERDAAKMAGDDITKISRERDALSAQALGMKAEIEALKKDKTRMSPDEMKKLADEADRRKAEYEAAEKQIVALKSDAARKDQEIASLRTQVTTFQGELATLREQSGGYQKKMAELVLQLKNLQEAKPGMSPELAQENATLREIVMRQLSAQYRQQQAKNLVISELQKMEGVSPDLLAQLTELKNDRLTLTADEEKIFTDPAVREMLGNNGIQGTLIARASKPESPKPADSVDVLLGKANEAFSSQHFSDASALYKEALEIDPKNTTALVGLGYSSEREKNYPEAEAALKKCLIYDPKNEMASFHLGVTYFKQDRWNDAMSFFEKNLTNNPKNARSRHYLGIIATKLNFLDRAEREFRAALSIDPSYGEAHFNLAVLYATGNPPQWDKARTEYEQAIKKGVPPDESLESLLKRDGTKAVSTR